MLQSQVTEKELFSDFERYLQWEKQSFKGWENVKIFIAETLSEAWLQARPDDAYKFNDPKFKHMVDRANGKWLEKLSEDDSYKIILATQYCKSQHQLVSVLVHEMRHCLDYQNAVENLSFEDYRPGNMYYNNWSEFRAVYAQTRYEYFSRCEAAGNSNHSFIILSELLGKSAADSTTGIMRSRDDFKDTLYYISRYIGASRAIQNLNIEEKVGAAVFNLWHMTPQYIIEKFGIVFYIGNEWEETEICGLNASPKTYYYNDLVKKITSSLD